MNTGIHRYIRTFRIHTRTCIKINQESMHTYVCILHISKYVRIKIDIRKYVHEYISAHMYVYTNVRTFM